jgi:hypothetical protein
MASIATSAVTKPRPPLPQSAFDRDLAAAVACAPQRARALFSSFAAVHPHLPFSFPRPRAGRMSACSANAGSARRRENLAEPTVERGAFIPRQGETAASSLEREGAAAVASPPWRAVRSPEICLARARRGSRAWRAGGGTTRARKLLWKLDPGAVDRLGRLRRGRALVSATNGKTTTSAMAARILAPRSARAQPVRARTSSPGSPPRCSAAPDASSACSRSTRRPAGGRTARPPARVCSGTSSATSSTATASSSSWRRAGARWRRAAEDAVLVVERRRPAARATLARDDGRVVFGLDDPRHASTELQHAADSKWCVRCGTPYEYAAAYIGHLGDYRCPSCGHARPPLDVAARTIELNGLESALVRPRRPEGPAVELACRGSTTSTTRSRGGARSPRAGASLTRLGGLQGFPPPSGASSGSRRSEPLLVLLIKNPGRERGRQDAGRRGSALAAPDRAQRRDRGRARRVLDLGRGLRAAARPARAAGRDRGAGRRARAAVQVRGSGG